MRNRNSYIFLVTASVLCSLTTKAKAIDWPVWPDSNNHRIGNAYLQYQCYNEPNCNGYFHPGIDILVPAGTPVYATTSGYVKVLKKFGESDLQWRLVIGDSSGTQECDAWRYDHMDRATIPHSVGDTIVAGQFLGNVVIWSGYDFHHLHLTQIRCQGDSTEWGDNLQWRYVSNALDLLDPISDPDPPVFENAYASQVFAYVSNNTDSYFPIDSPISGDVDIVCKVYDLINDDYWKVTPYQIEYQITGDSTTPWINAVCFTGEVVSIADSTAPHATDIIYQDDTTCDTRCTYVVREFYFNVTNTDGDSVLEFSDKDHSWQTSYFHNGQYTVSVRAYDAYGNAAEESMAITVDNYFELSGTILFGEKNSNGQTIITVASSGQSDTADINGLFSIPDVGGGSQLIEIRNGNYDPVDTVIMMSQNQQLTVTLNPCCNTDGIRGDADSDCSFGCVTVSDLSFLVAYLFQSGPSPVCEDEANADGDCTFGCVTVADLSFLVTYLFQEGTPPGACP